MFKSDKMSKNKVLKKSVNNQLEIKYQKKFPQNSKVFVRNISQDKFQKDNSSNEFKTIMTQMYSEIGKNKEINKDYENINNYMSPKKKTYFNINSKNEKNKNQINSNIAQNLDFEKIKDRISIKRVKLNKENDEILSPYNEYNNQLMDRFTQISIIKPNNNDIFMEQSSDTDLQNEEYVYFYEPKKELKLELGNSNKREIKSIYANNFMENKLIFSNQINFSIDRRIDESKIKYNMKYLELIKKEELYNKLINKYNKLIKELNELKNKNIINSEKERGGEKIIQHLEDIFIINNFGRKRPKIKKIRNKKRRMKSLTPIKNNYSSSEETKTRDNSLKGHGSSNLFNELKIKKEKYFPNIMLISKENEFNLTASYNKLELNSNNKTIINKPNKKISKVQKKKNKKEDNWNILNKVLNSISFGIIGKKNISQNINVKKIKNKKNKKKRILILKPKGENEKKERPTSRNTSHRKIKKLNLPVINVKNEILSYNIKKNYIRFKKETKSVDLKISKNNSNIGNINQNNQKWTPCQVESLSVDKKQNKNYIKDDIIVKNINLNIINNFNDKYRNSEKKEKNQNKIDEDKIRKRSEIQNFENNSENKDFSYYSSEIKENSIYYSEDEKNMMNKDEIEDYKENKNNEMNYIKNKVKDKKLSFKIKIVKYSNKKKKDNIYFDALFKKLINKLLVKRVFKKWLKLVK